VSGAPRRCRTSFRARAGLLHTVRSIEGREVSDLTQVHAKHLQQCKQGAAQRDARDTERRLELTNTSLKPSLNELNEHLVIICMLKSIDRFNVVLC